MAEVYLGVGDYLAQSEDIDLGPALDDLAHKVLAKAQSLAAQHVETGEYLESLQIAVDHTSPSKRDRFVYSDHPAAMSIEYGHIAHSVDGVATRVPAQHILGRAADSVT